MNEKKGVFCFVSGAYIQFLLLPPGEASRALHRALAGKRSFSFELRDHHRPFAEAVSRIIERNGLPVNVDFELVFLRANLALQGGEKYRKASEFCEIAAGKTKARIEKEANKDDL